jgi:hypothetical protein
MGDAARQPEVYFMRTEANGDNVLARLVEDELASQPTQNSAHTATQNPRAGFQQAAPLPARNPKAASTGAQKLLSRFGGEPGAALHEPDREQAARLVSRSSVGTRPQGDGIGAARDITRRESSTPLATNERIRQAATGTSGRTPRSPTSPPPPAPGTLPHGATSTQFYGLTVHLRPSLMPANPTPEQVTRFGIADTLYRPASASSGVTSSYLHQEDLEDNPRVQAVSQGRRIESGCLGCTLQVMRGAATNTRQANLFDSANAVGKAYAKGGQSRTAVLASIRNLQGDGRWSGDTRELPGYIRHPGRSGLRSGVDLVSDLEDHFATPYNPQSEAMGHPNTFALIGLSLGNAPAGTFSVDAPAHALSVQRLHSNGDYRNDAYTLYDSSQGAFRYANFGQLTYALSHYFDAAYPGLGGFTSASTSYYAMQNIRQHALGGQRLGDVGASYGMLPLPVPLPANFGAEDYEPLHIPVPTLTPPRADLPPLPSFDQPGPSGYQPQARDELKRSTDDPRALQPMALYRPSSVAPGDLKKAGGFGAEQMAVRQINLDLHDFDMAANPTLVEGSGYLGTFRKLETAQQNPALTDSKDGYVYAVAPSPNMVDVASTLGANARNAHRGEVAAMGRIDYTQIRGWQKIENGKPGAFTPNPDYRWDIYDQTRIAGAQPQLSRFTASDINWADAAHRPFVTAKTDDGKTVYLPRQDPDLAHASFYNHALEKIAYLNDRQTQGQDYRGPVKLVSHDGAYGTLQGNLNLAPNQHHTPGITGSSDVTVVNNDNQPGIHTFRMDGDGRFHTQIFGKEAVLRVGGDGYLYLGDVPSDPQNKNGVFRYDRNNRLIHAEDGKVLTYSHRGWAYVSSSSYHSNYSVWKLTDDRDKSYRPPKSIYEYRDRTAGSARTQFDFDRDPDSALPPGVTRFATSLPGAPSGYDRANAFLSGSAADKQAAADWLNGHTAALLLKDGFYVTATGDHTLDIRNLQGNTVRTLHLDATSDDDHSNIVSDYSVPNQTWTHLQQQHERYMHFEDLNKAS